MSALQQQLEAAGIAQYTGASHKAARYGGRASFLFDGVAALDVDLATLFEIGRNGIEELQARDPNTFTPFVKPFFSVAASQKDRTLLTQQENDKIDQQLASLLWALSPHFMDKPAHKVCVVMPACTCSAWKPRLPRNMIPFLSGIGVAGAPVQDSRT